MSTELIDRSPDLQRLVHDGYEVEIRSGHLIVHSVPYVNSQGGIADGTIVTDLTLSADRTQIPGDHQIWFKGEHPCNKDGAAIQALGAGGPVFQTLCEGIEVNYRFSCKPQNGYPDYHAKMTRYIDIITGPARAINPKATARTYKPITSVNEDPVFIYTDTASSRAGIAIVAKKVCMEKIGIVGLGGTGSYVLDLVSKTPVKEIHLFDGDLFYQHNAFRAPGAASFEILNAKPSKVNYYADIYGKMHRHIFPHEEYLSGETIIQLSGIDFVFLCVDKPAVRKLVSNFLHDQKVPFIDVGMNVELIDEMQCLRGSCRVTLSTPAQNEHFSKHVSLSDATTDDLYASNIQVADLNSLSAALAVIRWKKYCGFYQDHSNEHQSAFVISTHQLTSDERK